MNINLVMILFAVKIEILLDRLHKYNLPDYSNNDHFKIKMGHRYVCQIFLNLQYIKAKSSEVYIYLSGNTEYGDHVTG